MYYEDYRFSEDDLKTDFHIALDEIIDAEVEKRLESRIEDINILRENQKQYAEKIVEAQKKAKEADDKRREAERARDSAEIERDNTISQCKQSISDATQKKLDKMFGDWLKEKYVYFLRKKKDYLSCPYCRGGKVNITLSNGDKAVTNCKVCNGEGHMEYDAYESEIITTSYPSFIKENHDKSIAPYFLDYRWSTGLTRVALRDVMTQKEATDKAEMLTKENKQEILKYLEDRKKKLDKGEST